MSEERERRGKERYLRGSSIVSPILLARGKVRRGDEGGDTTSLLRYLFLYNLNS